MTIICFLILIWCSYPTRKLYISALFHWPMLYEYAFPRAIHQGSPQFPQVKQQDGRKSGWSRGNLGFEPSFVLSVTTMSPSLSLADCKTYYVPDQVGVKVNVKVHEKMHTCLQVNVLNYFTFSLLQLLPFLFASRFAVGKLFWTTRDQAPWFGLNTSISIYL